MSPVKMLLAPVFALLILMNSAAVAAAKSAHMADFYVSPSGNDANPGTVQQPFKTLTRARDAVRLLKIGQQSGAVKDITVMLRGGRYYLARPVRFNENDSGNYGHTITYRNYPGETPVLIAGVRIGGWERYRGHIYKAHVPLLGTNLFDVHQILENGKPAWPARAPNEGWFAMQSPQRRSFCYRAQDLAIGDWDTSQMTVLMYEVGTYFSNRIPVERIDRKDRRITLRARPFYAPVPGLNYILEGALELLDAPGEFFADPKSETLYYWPRQPDIASSEIVVPISPSLLQFQAYSDEAPVHDITIEGLKLLGGATPGLTAGPWSNEGDNGHPKVQFDRETPLASSRWGQIELKNAQRISIRNCRILYGGMNGIALNGCSTHNTISGCEIAGSAQNGILLSGDPLPPDATSPPPENGYNTITNNYIHHTGRLLATGAGIDVGGSEHNLISHNLITDTSRAGVLIFFQWDVPRALTPTRDNVISYNELARTGTATWDGGAFYIGATTDHTIFEQNRIADIHSWFVQTYHPPRARPNDNCSIDFDPGAAGCFDTILRNNLCFGAASWTIETGSPQEYKPSNNYFDRDFHHPNQIMVDGVWKPAPPFDPAQVHPSEMGLTKDFPFPYPHEAPRPLALPIHIDFEGTLSPCYLYKWTGGPEADYLTTQEAHSGRYALQVDKDVMVVRYRHPNPIAATVSLWFFDDPSKTQATCFAAIRDAAKRQLAVGVEGAASPDHYVIRSGSRVRVSQVKRSAGWHRIQFKPSAGEWVVSIDGHQVAREPSFRFCYIDLGDDTNHTDSRGLAFDDLTIASP